MSLDDFKLAYQPLANKWPQIYAKPEFRQTMFEACAGFQIEWVRALVQKIIMSANPNFNILEEIQKEKRMRGFDRVNNDNREEYERIRRNSTDHGFEVELRKREATSLWEAVEKAKKESDPWA